MYLTEEQKEDIRYELALKLQNSKINSRVHIDKDILERLIFDEGYYNGNKCKVIVWSGDFLSKIDLSELSFDNVIWRAGYKGYKNKIYDYDKIPIILDNTNATIDFSKAAKVTNGITKDIMYLCSFKNVDLTRSNLCSFDYYNNCNFEKTKLSFEFDKFVLFDECDFSGADVGNLSINSTLFVDKFRNCDFSDTNINIEHKIYNLGESKFKILRDEDGKICDFDKVSEELERQFNNKMLSGCNINNFPFVIKEQVFHKRNESVKKYTDCIINDIDNQINSYVKKL